MFVIRCDYFEIKAEIRTILFIINLIAAVKIMFNFFLTIFNKINLLREH